MKYSKNDTVKIIADTDTIDPHNLPIGTRLLISEVDEGHQYYVAHDDGGYAWLVGDEDVEKVPVYGEPGFVVGNQEQQSDEEWEQDLDDLLEELDELRLGRPTKFENQLAYLHSLTQLYDRVRDESRKEDNSLRELVLKKISLLLESINIE